MAERELAERLAELLPECGAASVTLTDAGDEPVLEPWPGSAALWSATRVSALIEAGASADGLRARLAAALAPRPVPPWTARPVAERDWVRETQARFSAMRFGERLCVCPSWCEPPADAPVVVRLDPGVAFGTGTHESTALCLEWLDGAGLADSSVIDYGCGSGILGIAALALGARHVQAVDIDPQALAATADNAGRNGLAHRVAPRAPDDPLEPAELVIANILAGPLVELAPTLLALLRPGGRIALAGITLEQLPRVCRAYEPGVAWRAPRHAGAWALAVGDAR